MNKLYENKTFKASEVGTKKTTESDKKQYESKVISGKDCKREVK